MKPVAWIKIRELSYMKAVAEHGKDDWQTNLGLKPEPDDEGLYTETQVQMIRKQVEELTELFHLQSQRAMDYAGMAMRKREWVGLEEAEIKSLRHLIDWTAVWSYGNFARAIEAKLKEKNNG